MSDPLTWQGSDRRGQWSSGDAEAGRQADHLDRATQLDQAFCEQRLDAHKRLSASATRLAWLLATALRFWDRGPPKFLMGHVLAQEHSPGHA